MKNDEIRHYSRDDREYSFYRARLHNNQKKFDRDFSSHLCSDIRSLTVEFSMTFLILRETISFVRFKNCTLSIRFIREKIVMKINYK
jgi:hypothetical protein